MKDLIVVILNFTVFGVILAAVNDTQKNVPEVTTIAAAVQDTTEVSTNIPIQPRDETENCDETINKDTEITSSNYPEAYDKNYTWCLSMTGSSGVDIEFKDLDVDPKLDYIFIRGLGIEDSKSQYITGVDNSSRFRFTRTNKAAIKFVTQQLSEHKFKGFKIQVSGVGSDEITTEEPTTTTVPPYTGGFVTLIKDVVMSKEAQDDNQTFTVVLREILMNSTNEWLKANNLDERMERCREENVIIHKIFRCPKSWPKNDECVRIEFAIPLNETDYVVLTKPESSVKISEQYELSVDNLELMWQEFGKNNMKAAGFDEYQLPNQTAILSVWISVSIFVIGAFLFVLYGIWKLDFLMDYRRMDGFSEKEDVEEPTKRKSNLDLSLWPSPNQEVPPFLSELDTYTGFDSKFVINDAEDSVFDARQGTGHEKTEFEDHPGAYNNPFAAEIVASEHPNQQRVYPRNY